MSSHLNEVIYGKKRVNSKQPKHKISSIKQIVLNANAALTINKQLDAKITFIAKCPRP